MNKIQVLIATMNNDFSLIKKMNLNVPCIIANQSGINKIEYNNDSIMISSDTIGVGNNRNIALNHSDAEIVVFADDDVYYYDENLTDIISFFDNNPQVDLALFGIDYTKDGKIYRTKVGETKKLTIYNGLKYGAISFAARRKPLLENNIVFNTNFGGGSIFGSGEDTLFLKECFDKKLNIYSVNHIIGKTSSDDSSWFSGYNDKFFYDKGALLKQLFPKLYSILIFRYARIYSKKSGSSLQRVLRFMKDGIKNSDALIPYEKYINKR